MESTGNKLNAVKRNNKIIGYCSAPDTTDGYPHRYKIYSKHKSYIAIFDRHQKHVWVKVFNAHQLKLAQKIVKNKFVKDVDLINEFFNKQKKKS